MELRFGTFNLFQFCSFEKYFYDKNSKYSKENWIKKLSWCNKQINLMNCDIIGFQEVFSQNILKKLCFENGFKYFEVVDFPQISKDNEKIYTSTTVAIASKYEIVKTKRIFSTKHKFARIPIKCKIKIKNNLNIFVYVCHLKSNRNNEFEYSFKKHDNVKQKIKQTQNAINMNYSLSLNQRLNEAKTLYCDIKNNDIPSVLLCDLNDKEFSLTIDALTNKKFYNNNLLKDEYILLDAFYLFKPKNYNPHPEQKEIKRIPTSYFAGKGNILDYIFVSKELKKISSYEIFDNHLKIHKNGSLQTSDHAQVVCEIKV